MCTPNRRIYQAALPNLSASFPFSPRKEKSRLDYTPWHPITKLIIPNDCKNSAPLRRELWLKQKRKERFVRDFRFVLVELGVSTSGISTNSKKNLSTSATAKSSSRYNQQQLAGGNSSGELESLFAHGATNLVSQAAVRNFTSLCVYDVL